MELSVTVSPSGMVCTALCETQLEYDPFDMAEHLIAIDQVIDAQQNAPVMTRFRQVGAMLAERFSLPRTRTLFETQAFCKANDAVFEFLKKNLDETPGKVAASLTGTTSTQPAGPAPNASPGSTTSIDYGP